MMQRLAVKMIGLGALFSVALLHQNARAQNAGIPPEEVAAHISGKWVGSNIDGKGKYFSASVTLSGESTKNISGVADLPDSLADKAPKMTGSYSGSVVELTASSGFNWHLVMSKDSSGKYHLDGTYAGARGSGKVVLVKQ
jgi:hypothetical protein